MKATDTTSREGNDSRRAISYPLNALLVVLITATANAAVWFAGREGFVQVPSIIVPLRNVAIVSLILLFGRFLMSQRDRRAELFLLIATLLFGLGLAMQFRLGHDAPRQLAGREVELVADTVRFRMQGEPEDSIAAAIKARVNGYNASLRRDFDQGRIDVRLARSLEEEYGASDTTSPFLQGRSTAPTDSLIFRILPLLAALGGIFLFSRSRFAATLASQWRAVGLYGSLALCAVTFLYLGSVGGIRGSSVSPQELLKLSIPIAWAGLLLRYRNVFLGESLARMTDRPLVLWLYVLGLLALPLLVFVAVRDFGQFLAIGLAQILLLAWFTRSTLYVLLFGSGLTIASIVLLGNSIEFASPVLLILLVLLLTVLALAGLERFATRGALWPTASIVLVGFGLLAWVASLLPVVQKMLETPRARFMLWADLFARHDNPNWWDNSRQVVEALYAFDAGGVVGQGFGGGSPFLIPKSGSDFIFAAFVEELGLLGGILILLAFLTLIIIGLRIAADRDRGSFAGLLVAGYVLLIASQTFVHVAGTMNVMPMTGITLPLVSSGMSSIVVTWLLVGAIVGIAAGREGRKEGDDFVVVSKGK
ncbi:MAG: FtsW/RodA/SpoVE family cell cycle protein [Ignavibacteriae bacterium]|nr:FtsW/RodA/SpoVE family cell cycle protein [Ignavibacteriota bacterium]MCB9216559.1 FtsW/RodA/SpoVE family cell cycle protein [Ignavibacteria bacterium]